MEPDIAQIIDNEVKKLEQEGNWTEIERADFNNLPVAVIAYGKIMSNGQNERAIGDVVIWKDGKVTRAFHL